MDSKTEPPHSPPTPIPWIVRKIVNRMPPHTPMLAYGGTRPITNVPMPINSRLATSVALRPIRSP
jgi:hypothetical protein